jgi:hypothetical protein
MKDAISGNIKLENVVHHVADHLGLPVDAVQVRLVEPDDKAGRQVVPAANEGTLQQLRDRWSIWAIWEREHPNHE